MTLLPKPVRTEKRAPQVLRRKRGPNRKRKTSRGAQGRLADKLFSLIVRSKGQCAAHAPIASDPFGTGCTQGLQCAHIVSRSYRSVRWDESNAMPLCAKAHVYWTHHPIEWERFVIERIGAADFEALKIRALRKWDGDLEGVLVRLAARAVALGIEAK